MAVLLNIVRDLICAFSKVSPHQTGTSASVAEWLRAWDTLTMFEATVCGRS